MGLADFEECAVSVGRGWLSLCERGADGFRTGTYRHPLGMAEINSGFGWTSIGVIRDGRFVYRRWKRDDFGEKTISRLCRELLEDTNA